MIFTSIISFVNFNIQCPFCKQNIPLKISDFLQTENLSHELKDNIFSLKLKKSSTKNIYIDSDKNSYSIPPWIKNIREFSLSLTSRNVCLYRKCDCKNKFWFKTCPLIFNEDATIKKLKLNFLEFRIHKDNSFLIINNKFNREITSIIDIPVDASYASVIKETKYVELPLISFDFSQKDKLLQKINTLITFS